VRKPFLVCWKRHTPWFTKFEFEKFFSLFYIISTQRNYIHPKLDTNSCFAKLRAPGYVTSKHTKNINFKSVQFFLYILYRRLIGTGAPATKYLHRSSLSTCVLKRHVIYLSRNTKSIAMALCKSKLKFTTKWRSLPQSNIWFTPEIFILGFCCQKEKCFFLELDGSQLVTRKLNYTYQFYLLTTKYKTILVYIS
jgi:hypothetical protein